MTETKQKRACVIGHPIGHSRSPIIHNHWLDVLGLEGAYDKRDVAPDDLARFFASMQAEGLVGCNVTVPHKEAAFRIADRRDAAAEAIGAANTIWFEKGELVAGNTDGLGFLANLDQHAPGWDREKGPAIVLGAGGAARAIIHALLDRGFAPVRVVNRTLAKAEAMGIQFGPDVEAWAWEDLDKALMGGAVLVNTTSLGMKGQPDLVITLDNLPATALVTDIVYVPLETSLLAAARKRGHPTVDGLGMLLHQAAPGFAHWFGTMPEVTETLRALILSDMGIADTKD